MKLENMIVAARIDAECWIISQMFSGYGGYVYEVLNRWSNANLYYFAFIGDKMPSPDDFETEKCEIVLTFDEGIKYLKGKLSFWEYKMIEP